MSRSDQDRLQDILHAIGRCHQYQEHLQSAALGAMAYDAILRNLAVIGEAVRSLPDQSRATMPGVPWPAIAGLRNVVVHEYFRVNPDLIVDILDNQLAPLADEIRQSLSRG